MSAQKKKKIRRGSLTHLFLSSERKKQQNTAFFLSEAAFFILLIFVICAAYYYIAIFVHNPVISPISVRPILRMAENLGILTPKKQTRDVIGFLPSWTVAQTTDVHTKDLTQLIYFGLGVTENGDLIKYDKDNNPVLEWEHFKGENFSRLKQQAKKNNTKILVSIKNFDNVSIDTLISNPYATDLFIRQIREIVTEEQLDGINLDFEYITDSDFPTAKFLNSFLQKVTAAIKNDNPKAILSLDVNATVVLGDKAYEMEKIGDIVDQVILMAYDYRRIDSTIAGPVAPLYSGFFEHSIDQSIYALLQEVSSTKIILGVPLYGYEWQTYSDKPKSMVVKSSGALATYKRVRLLLDSRDDIVVQWDDKAKVPWFVYRDNGEVKTIYYENKRSIQEKLMYQKENELGGIALWALGYEGTNEDLWQTIREER